MPPERRRKRKAAKSGRHKQANYWSESETKESIGKLSRRANPARACRETSNLLVVVVLVVLVVKIAALSQFYFLLMSFFPRRIRTWRAKRLLRMRTPTASLPARYSLAGQVNVTQASLAVGAAKSPAEQQEVIGLRKKSCYIKV